MKKHFILTALALLGIPSMVYSDDLFIPTMDYNEAISFENARFDICYGNIGNTGDATIVCLGEVDLGTDGKAYQAVGVEFANGWGGWGEDRSVVISAGDTYDLSEALDTIAVDRTHGYHDFELFASNYTTTLTGKQTMWLHFGKSNGNLRSVTFFENAVAEGKQPHADELAENAGKFVIVNANGFEAYNGDQFPDTRINESTGMWGWVGNGFIAKTIEAVDFGTDGFAQIVAFIGHDGQRNGEQIEFYIDEPTDDNLIAKTWSGINLGDWDYGCPVATVVKAGITGEHNVFVKLHDNTNLQKVEFVKEAIWFQNPSFEIPATEDLTPSEWAVKYVTKGDGKVEGEMQWDILVPGTSGARGEGENIGYISDGVVVRYNDIDFQKGQYKKVYINHSSDKNWLGNIRCANFSLYVDLDNVDWSAIDNNPSKLKKALAGYEPIAVVRAQGTNGWGNKKTTGADIQSVAGVHDLYVVYNMAEGGANVYGLYLDPEMDITPVPGAEDAYISLMKGSNIEIVKDGKFDIAYGNVGNTSDNTVLYLGEYNLGDNGTAYQAAGVEYAQGWGGWGEDRSVVISAGETFELSEALVTIALDRTHGYHDFDLFASNFTKVVSGTQKLWLSFGKSNGNLRSVTLYNHEVTEGLQPRVDELPENAGKFMTIQAAEFEAYQNTQYENAHVDDKGFWGNLGNGFMIKTLAPVDFGSDGFAQIVAFIAHPGERRGEQMEFYIDEPTAENLIAKTWAGINLDSWDQATPIATAVKAGVTGEHYVFVKFFDSTNLQKIEFTTENIWFPNPSFEIVIEDYQPSEWATKYVTKGDGRVEGEMQWDILVPGASGARGEGNNIGYISNGVVVRYNDIDFQKGQYKKIYVEHSAASSYLGTIDIANFSFYVDLDSIDWSTATTPADLKQALAGYEPFAVVRAQGTGDWGNHKTTYAEMQTVSGIHDVYVVYNLQEDGANVYGVYFDPEKDITIHAAEKDAYISLMKGSDIEIVKDGRFDIAYGNVGNTSDNTVLYLGEYDLGSNGTAYQAAGVEYAQGWGGWGEERSVVISAGETFDVAQAVATIALDRTHGYHDFELFANNFTTDITGIQKLWLSFGKSNGNLRSVTLYNHEVTDGKQPHADELAENAGKFIIINADGFEAYNGDQFPDTRINESTGMWGWVGNGFIAKSIAPVDFGTDGFAQVVAFIGHDGERYTEQMEFYIDEPTDDNLIAKTWSGINLGDWDYGSPVATAVKAGITGQHTVFVKLHDNTNLQKVEFTTEPIWFENPAFELVYEDYQPSEWATKYVTKGDGKVEGEMQWDILVPGASGARGEGENIGFISNGVVVVYHDIDFLEGQYKKIYVEHSADKNWLGTIDIANFSFYLDLDGIDWSTATTPEDLQKALVGYEPFAVVRAQGTAGWGNKKTTFAEMQTVSGIHDVYVVYNLLVDGANIYGVYLDPETDLAVDVIDAADTVREYYTTSGIRVIDATTAGSYIVRSTAADGKVTVRKVIVK